MPGFILLWIIISFFNNSISGDTNKQHIAIPHTAITSESQNIDKDQVSEKYTNFPNKDMMNKLIESSCNEANERPANSANNVKFFLLNTELQKYIEREYTNEINANVNESVIFAYMLIDIKSGNLVITENDSSRFIGIVIYIKNRVIKKIQWVDPMGKEIPDSVSNDIKILFGDVEIEKIFNKEVCQQNCITKRDCDASFVAKAFDDLSNGLDPAATTDNTNYNNEKVQVALENGCSYEGFMKDGKKNGPGKYTDANGAKYEGIWKDDKLDENEEVIVNIKNVGLYKGRMKNGKRDGYGIYTAANDDKYEGFWKDDKKYGRGKYTNANGNESEGIWKDDKLDENEEVIVNIKNVGLYKGRMKNGTRDGYGIYTAANGDIYQGNYKDDKTDGYGIYTGADGTKYEGFWKDDKRDGHGKYTCANGTEYEGIWKDDKLDENKEISMNVKNVGLYKGHMKNGKRNGYGVYKLANGIEYKGQWANDKMHGIGTMKNAYGRIIYSGAWKNNEQSGK